MGIGHENGSHLVKLQPIRGGIAVGTSPPLAVSSATFTCVGNVIVLTYFINNNRIEVIRTEFKCSDWPKLSENCRARTSVILAAA
jgi:hypothetical protein